MNERGLMIVDDTSRWDDGRVLAAVTVAVLAAITVVRELRQVSRSNQAMTDIFYGSRAQTSVVGDLVFHPDGLVTRRSRSSSRSGSGRQESS